MDNIYTNSYLRNFLNKVYSKNLNNEEIFEFLSQLVTLTNNCFNNNENNYLIILIITCINKNNLTYQNQMLINEIINTFLLDQLEISLNNKENIKNSNTFIDYNTLDLSDKEAVKAYFLQENKHLDANNNFSYPPKGKTSIITMGDNITIPGIKYIINYVIDHNGDVIDIQGYPKQELDQNGYEEIYSDLIKSIFKEE